MTKIAYNACYGGFRQAGTLFLGLLVSICCFCNESHGLQLMGNGDGRYFASNFDIRNVIGDVGDVGFAFSYNAIADANKNYQQESETRKTIRIVSDPLRLEGQLPIKDQFFFFVLFIFGLLFGGLSGEYFYRERYFIGAALLGFGFSCAFLSWRLL